MYNLQSSWANSKFLALFVVCQLDVVKGFLKKNLAFIYNFQKSNVDLKI